MLPQVEGSVQVAISGRVDEHGDTFVAGAAWNRATHTVLIAQSNGSNASCADTDNNGVAGFSGLEIAFKDIRSSQTVLATVVPDGGDLERRGRYPATIQFTSRGMPSDPLPWLIHLDRVPVTSLAGR